MTDAQKLEALIQKAIDGGWARPGITDEGEMHFGDRGILVDWLRGGREYMSIGDLMLAHDFAKALWGEDLLNQSNGIPYRPNKLPAGAIETSWTWHSWQYHLQQAVILPTTSEQIGYMYRTVFGD